MTIHQTCYVYISGAFWIKFVKVI